MHNIVPSGLSRSKPYRRHEDLTTGALADEAMRHLGNSYAIHFRYITSWLWVVASSRTSPVPSRTTTRLTQSSQSSSLMHRCRIRFASNEGSFAPVWDFEAYQHFTLFCSGILEVTSWMLVCSSHPS